MGKDKNKLIRKEQCPDCAKMGKDTSKDNLAIYSDGQTHCFACGKHGFVTHTKSKPIQIKDTKEDLRDFFASIKGFFIKQ